MNCNHIDLHQLEALSAGDKRPYDMAPQDWRTLVIVAYFTGLRACDLRRLRCDHIDFDAGTLSMTLLKTGNPVCLPLQSSTSSSFSEQAELCSDLLRRLMVFSPICDSGRMSPWNQSLTAWARPCYATQQLK